MFTRVIILVNPKSTNARFVTKRIRALQEECAGISKIIQTDKGGRSAAQQLIRDLDKSDALGPTTLLAIAAGDGTINSIVEALLTTKSVSSKARRTVILPLWGGNANDLAHMLNGPVRRNNIKEILESGKVVPIYPLVCELRESDGSVRKRLGLGYLSFGATGYVSQRIDELKPYIRRVLIGRRVLELAIALNALIDSPKLTIQRDGRTHSVFELIFANGSRMGRFEHLPAKLHEKTYYHATVRHKNLRAILQHMMELSSGKISGETDPTMATFTILEDVWGQFDGEVILVPAHTTVVIRHNDTPFYALSTLSEEA